MAEQLVIPELYSGMYIPLYAQYHVVCSMYCVVENTVPVYCTVVAPLSYSAGTGQYYPYRLPVGVEGGIRGVKHVRGPMSWPIYVQY